MSSIAGPSSHALSSFPTHPRQPSAISTKLQHLQNAPDYALSPGSGAATPATPILTTAPTTAPPTPITRSISTTTDAREPSVDPAVLNGYAPNGTSETRPPGETPRVPQERIAADLDAVRARAIALSKKHGRDADEADAMVQTAARIATQLAEDHRAALFPDVDEPFTDEVDVVKRLLPYHVFQQPKEDLDVMLHAGSSKGKRKATEEDLLREEIADTKFALQCWKRKRALEQRIRNARIESGKMASPSDQGYILAQAVLEIERAENTSLSAELRSARAELDKLEREKRAAAPPPSTPAPKPTPSVRTTSSSSYYPASTTSTPTTATFMPPYRPPYSYTYSQYPSTQYTYNPYNTYASATSTPYGSTSQTQTPATPTSTYTPPTAATTATPTSAVLAQVQQAQAQASSAISSTAIPVQLPVSSLPALASLGIIPVAAASLPPAGQPQPAAVIRSTNGTTLSLEINLSLLQAAQTSGLVRILNALTSRGVNVDGSAGASSAGGAAASATSAGATNGSSGSGTQSATSSGPSTAASSASTASASSSSSSSGPTSPASAS